MPALVTVEEDAHLTQAACRFEVKPFEIFTDAITDLEIRMPALVGTSGN